MAFNLDEYIENYIQDAEAFDRNVAQHLKEIIPNTTHLDENIYNEIIREFKDDMDRGENFKNTFHKVCGKHLLNGNIIEAKLPALLTRIILDDTEFMEKIAEERGIPSSQEDIREIVDSKKKDQIAELFKNIELNIREVVFATFDEYDMDADPFVNYSIKDIVNMLALNLSSFNENKPLTAVSIRYKNRDDFVKRFPVFPDAGWYDKFYPSDEDDKYGRTKSLDQSLKNMPEIVHENLKLADVIKDIWFLEE
jgi:hypothetical protein